MVFVFLSFVEKKKQQYNSYFTFGPGKILFIHPVILLRSELFIQFHAHRAVLWAQFFLFVDQNFASVIEHYMILYDAYLAIENPFHLAFDELWIFRNAWVFSGQVSSILLTIKFISRIQTFIKMCVFKYHLPPPQVTEHNDIGAISHWYIGCEHVDPLPPHTPHASTFFDEPIRKSHPTRCKLKNNNTN